MPLNLQTNDGDFTPFIKYNAKAGRWYVRVDGQDGDVEVTNPVLAFDFGNIKTGWLFYAEGLGPEKVWDPDPATAAPKPAGGKAFKRGFEVLVHGAGNVGVREFSSTAGSMIGPLNEIYGEYENGRTANPGKVPVFACVGVKPITGKHGTNYSPMFKLQSWVERSRIPFDNGGSSPPAQRYQGQAWTLEKCTEECAAVGIARADMVAHLKSLGSARFEPIRDTPHVQALIASKVPPPPDDGFGIDDGPPVNEIPF